MSRSTFTPSRLVMNIEPNVARILAKSRINNQRNGLVGVLYFGDGCFFQCLQGEETAIDALYALLQSDNRHKDLKLFSRKPISALAYADWSMKYVPIEKDMTRLLEQGGYQKFDPYQFDEAMIQAVMSLLQRSPDPTTGSKVEKMIQQSIKPPGVSKSKLGWSIVAIIVLIAALGIMIAAQQK